MKTTNLLLALAALAAPLALKAQQPPQGQVQSAPASAAPCGKQTPPSPHKPTWLEKKTKALACKQNRNFCDLPSSTEEVTGATPQPKTCPASPAPISPTPKSATSEKDKPAAPVNPATGTPSSGKPVLVCPPKSTLIPGFPYCVFPDRTVVDAMPLPTVSTPAPPASAAPAPAQH